MAECANRHGSEIAGVFPEDIEVLISAEKLRGTDFCVGAIDATTWRHTRINPVSATECINPLRHHHSVWCTLQAPDGQDTPCGAPIALRAWI